MFDDAESIVYDQAAGWSSLVARWAHNPKVGGSNPPPATNAIIRLRAIGLRVTVQNCPIRGTASQFPFLLNSRLGLQDFPGVIPKSPRFYQRAEGSPVARSVGAGDPFALPLRAGTSLRLKNGYAQSLP